MILSPSLYAYLLPTVVFPSLCPQPLLYYKLIRLHIILHCCFFCSCRLRDELKSQASELVTLQSRLKDSQINLSEFQSNQLPTQYQLTQTLHEKDVLAGQVKYLEQEVQRKVATERQLRNECAEKIEELEAALVIARADVEEKGKLVDKLKVLSH